MAGTALAPPMTIPHWYPFRKSMLMQGGDLQSPGNWDRIRTADPAGDFGFGTSREEWIARAHSRMLLQRAGVIADLMRRSGAARVVSVGVGTGLLEYLIAGMVPKVSWRCGDYAAASLELLRARFLECQSMELMDLRNPTWARDPDEVVLLNRVDTELNDAEWRTTFAELARRGIHTIIWVPCGLVSLDALLDQVRAVVVAIRLRCPLIRAGYLRTERRMSEIHSPSYRRSNVVSADLPIWLLRLRP